MRRLMSSARCVRPRVDDDGDCEFQREGCCPGAWLHVKMPAPPSVLGELPGHRGSDLPVRGDRFRHGEPRHWPGLKRGARAIPPIDVDALTKAVRRAPRRVRRQGCQRHCCQRSASALCAAAEDLDPVALLQAETNLANALADVGRQLSKSLTDSLGPIIEAQIDAPVESAADASGGDAPTMPPRPPTRLPPMIGPQQ